MASTWRRIRGAAVLAAAAGRVTFAGRLAGRGVVVVDHGAVRTTYEPVEPLAAVGDEVKAGPWSGGSAAAVTAAVTACTGDSSAVTSI